MENQVGFSGALFLIQTADIKLTGYPASDSQVRNWFKVPGLSPTQSDVRCSAFLTALLEETLKIVQDPKLQIHHAIKELSDLRDDERTTILGNYPTTPQEQFRLFMTVGQTFPNRAICVSNFMTGWLKEQMR